MGTFEKLGILVIVVIIVMILAVAIYQWGGSAAEPLTADGGRVPSLTVRLIDELGGEPAAPPQEEDPAAKEWPGGIPKRYVIQKNDKTWVLVVKRWRLKDSFIAVLAEANPKLDVNKLMPGQVLVIPDPSAHVRGAKKGAAPAQKGVRSYEVQIGDTLETIAFKHLGSRQRWKEILKVNPGLQPKKLRDGQQIFIPVR